jgi:lysophospholipase L1-like esterase
MAVAWRYFGADHPSIRTTGRAKQSDLKAPVLAWSGSTFQIAFTGTAARIRLSALGSVFNVLVDEDTIPRAILDLSENFDTVHTLVENLPLGPHSVTVFKRTESQYGAATFRGFEILGNSQLLDLPARPSRRIEFIGSSITCGYGNLDSVKENPFKITTEDFYFSYAARTARNLNAEFHTVCHSGRGISRNNTNGTEGTIPTLWPLISSQETSPWDFSAWIPDVVSLHISTNDFSKSIPDWATYTSATVQFILDIRSKYPNATILLLVGPRLSDDYPLATTADFVRYPIDSTGYPSAYMKQKINSSTGDTTYTYKSLTTCKRYIDDVLEVLASDGEKKVFQLSIPDRGASMGYGADYHPTAREHAAIANNLTSEIKTRMGW